MKAAGVALVAVLLSAMSFSSCTMETSDNGDLDGFWHLESIDSLATGTTVDLSQKRIFWAVEYKLISAREYDHSQERMYFRFEQTSDSLKITKVFLDHGHQDNGDNGGNIPLDEVTPELRYYGINALPEGFSKEAMSSSKMILRSKTVRLKFKKF